jgi:hypothetical protein
VLLADANAAMLPVLAREHEEEALHAERRDERVGGLHCGPEEEADIAPFHDLGHVHTVAYDPPPRRR